MSVWTMRSLGEILPGIMCVGERVFVCERECVCERQFVCERECVCVCLRERERECVWERE